MDAAAAVEHLGDDPDVRVAIGVGEEHAPHGATTLIVGGDGRAVVRCRADGEERELGGLLDGEQVSELGRDLARLGLTSLSAHPGDRRPGDVPVRVAVERAGETLHEAALWHGDRYSDPALDGVLVRYQRLVEELSGGELPFGRA